MRQAQIKHWQGFQWKQQLWGSWYIIFAWPDTRLQYSGYTWTSMKWLALLFLVVLGEGADNRHHPHEYDHDENGKCYGYGRISGIDSYTQIFLKLLSVSELKVSRTLIAEEWQEAARGFPSPAVECGDSGGEKFKADFNRIGAIWGQEIFDLVYLQVNEKNRTHDILSQSFRGNTKEARRVPTLKLVHRSSTKENPCFRLSQRVVISFTLSKINIINW